MCFPDVTAAQAWPYLTGGWPTGAAAGAAVDTWNGCRILGVMKIRTSSIFSRLSSLLKSHPKPRIFFKPGMPLVPSKFLCFVRPEMTIVSPSWTMRDVTVCFLIMKGFPSTVRVRSTSSFLTMISIFRV